MIVTLAVVAAVAASSAPRSRDDDCVAQEMTNPAVNGRPEWIATPSQADFVHAFPAGALKSGVSGRSTMNCAVDRDGRLHDCRVEIHYPAGYGFGAAALSLAGKYRMRANLTDGTPLCHTRTTVTITWGLAKPPRPH